MKSETGGQHVTRPQLLVAVDRTGNMRLRLGKEFLQYIGNRSRGKFPLSSRKNLSSVLLAIRHAKRAQGPAPFPPPYFPLKKTHHSRSKNATMAPINASVPPPSPRAPFFCFCRSASGTWVCIRMLTTRSIGVSTHFWDTWAGLRGTRTTSRECQPVLHVPHIVLQISFGGGGGGGLCC